ncbi:MAG: hypothetical protein J6K58_10615 [Lachnospiraceae bacterium]|nr:hypothetical protein [Lachnospiraceae bacterium]
MQEDTDSLFPVMKRLQPYFIVRGGDWGLIRVMSHNEPDNLFEGLSRKLV